MSASAAGWWRMGPVARAAFWLLSADSFVLCPLLAADRGAMSDSPSSRGAVIPPARRKSVLVRSAAHAAQTLPRGFVMPSAPEAIDAGASSSSGSSGSGSGGGIGLRATPTVSSNASVTAAVQRAQASARSTGGSSSPRSQSPASAGGTRRLNTAGAAAAAKGAGEAAAPSSKPPVPMFDAASDSAPSTTPRMRKSMSAAVTTPVAAASPTTPSRLSGGFSGAKARLSISRGYATLGRQSSISIAAGLLPRNADDDSPTTPTLGARSRTHSNASLHLPATGGSVATPTSEARRVSFGPRPSTASRPSIIGGQGINLLSPDMSHSGASHRRSMSTLSSANLSPSSYASSAPFDGPVVPYNAEDFVSAKSLSDSANSDNISVVVRCRPFIKEETARGVDTTKKSVVLSSDSVSCVWKGELRRFNYDHVFGDESTQRSVYLECAGSIVHQALQGYNGQHRFPGGRGRLDSGAIPHFLRKHSTDYRSAGAGAGERKRERTTSNSSHAFHGSALSLCLRSTSLSLSSHNFCLRTNR